MEKEGAATVDRPHNISAGDTLSGGMRVLLTPAGDRFKKMRRYVFHSHSPSRVTISNRIPPTALSTHIYSLKLWQTTPRRLCAMLGNISSTSSSTPKDTKTTQRGSLIPHIFPPIPHLIIIFYRYSASVVMSIGYGKESKSYHDPDIQAVNRCLTRLGNTLRPGVWKVDAYPFLR